MKNKLNPPNPQTPNGEVAEFFQRRDPVFRSLLLTRFSFASLFGALGLGALFSLLPSETWAILLYLGGFGVFFVYVFARWFHEDQTGIALLWGLGALLFGAFVLSEVRQYRAVEGRPPAIGISIHQAAQQDRSTFVWFRDAWAFWDYRSPTMLYALERRTKKKARSRRLRWQATIAIPLAAAGWTPREPVEAWSFCRTSLLRTRPLQAQIQAFERSCKRDFQRMLSCKNKVFFDTLRPFSSLGQRFPFCQGSQARAKTRLMSPLFQAEAKALEKRRLRVRPFAPFLFPLPDLERELREARRSLYGAILFLPTALFALFLLGVWSFAAWRLFLRRESFGHLSPTTARRGKDFQPTESYETSESLHLVRAANVSALEPSRS